jgi:hypothetical protein
MGHETKNDIETIQKYSNTSNNNWIKLVQLLIPVIFYAIIGLVGIIFGSRFFENHEQRITKNSEKIIEVNNDVITMKSDIGYIKDTLDEIKDKF